MKNSNPILYAFLFLSFCILPAHARIGETEKQIKQRYGDIVESGEWTYRGLQDELKRQGPLFFLWQGGKGGKYYMHKKSGLLVYVQYRNKYCNRIGFEKSNHAVLTEPEIQALLKANTNGAIGEFWKPEEKKSEDKSRAWRGESSATAWIGEDNSMLIITDLKNQDHEILDSAGKTLRGF